MRKLLNLIIIFILIQFISGCGDSLVNIKAPLEPVITDQIPQTKDPFEELKNQKFWLQLLWNHPANPIENAEKISDLDLYLLDSELTSNWEERLQLPLKNNDFIYGPTENIILDDLLSSEFKVAVYYLDDLNFGNSNLTLNLYSYGELLFTMSYRGLKQGEFLQLIQIDLSDVTPIISRIDLISTGIPTVTPEPTVTPKPGKPDKPKKPKK